MKKPSMMPEHLYHNKAPTKEKVSTVKGNAVLFSLPLTSELLKGTNSCFVSSPKQMFRDVIEHDFD